MALLFKESLVGKKPTLENIWQTNEGRETTKPDRQTVPNEMGAQIMEPQQKLFARYNIVDFCLLDPSVLCQIHAKCCFAEVGYSNK